MRAKYRILYYDKLCNKTIDHDLLTELEIKLDISTLIELREWAKLKAKKKPNSWFKGWFSTGNETGSESVIDENDRKRLLDIIEHTESINCEDQPGTIRYKVHINLPLLKLELTDLAFFALENAKLQFSSIPGSRSNIIDLSFTSVELTNLKTSKKIMESIKGTVF